MAQEIVTWCDCCFREDQRVPGRTVTVALNYATAKAIDLCDRHQKELVDPLAELLSDGRSAGGSTPERKRDHVSSEGPNAMECPVTDCEFSGPSRASLRGHSIAVHGKNLAQLEVIYLKTHSIEGKKLRYACPHCEPKAMFTHGAGLSTHLRYEHSDLIEEGEDEATLVM